MKRFEKFIREYVLFFPPPDFRSKPVEKEGRLDWSLKGYAMKNLPEVDLETVRNLEIEGENFSISNKKMINCKFISCNILCNGGPFQLDGCEFGDCRFVRIGSMEDAFNNVDAETIKGHLLKCWDDLRVLYDPNASVDDKGNVNFGKIDR